MCLIVVDFSIYLSAFLNMDTSQNQEFYVYIWKIITKALNVCLRTNFNFYLTIPIKTDKLILTYESMTLLFYHI